VNKTMTECRIGFIGGGNMSRSLVGGLLEQGVQASSLCIADPSAEARQKATEDFLVECYESGTQFVHDVDILVLAVKPQVMKSVCMDLAPAMGNHQPLIISVAAGVNSSSLERWLDGQRSIVRMMPNTPALIGLGASGIFANSRVSNQQKKLAWDLAQAVGIGIWVEQEAQIDVVTALSGSGPAYFFLVAEAMIQAGVSQGLEPEQARQLVLQTALGASSMMQQSDEQPATLRARVTSPGGTTERAVQELQNGQLEPLFQQAINAAVERGQQLAAVGEKS